MIIVGLGGNLGGEAVIVERFRRAREAFGQVGDPALAAGRLRRGRDVHTVEPVLAPQHVNRCRADEDGGAGNGFAHRPLARSQIAPAAASR